MAHKYATSRFVSEEILVFLSATSWLPEPLSCGQKRFHNLQLIRHAAPRFIIAEKSELNNNAHLEGTSTS